MALLRRMISTAQACCGPARAHGLAVDAQNVTALFSRDGSTAQSKENTMRPANIAYGLVIAAISLALAYAELRAEAVLNAGVAGLTEPNVMEPLIF
jgi:hypothetical protein